MTSRIAIIGARGFKSADESIRIECFPWNTIDQIENVSDYTGVIINVRSIDKSHPPDWETLFESLNSQAAMDLIRANGRLIVIGDPRFGVRYARREDGVDVSLPFLFWSCAEYEWDDRPGQTVTVSFDDTDDRKAYGRYLSHLKRWSYSLKKFSTRSDHMAEKLGLKTDVRPERSLTSTLVHSAFCKSQYSTSLASSFRGAILEPIAMSGGQKRLGAEFGRIVLLPEITLSDLDSISILLADAFGVQVDTPEPQWVERLKAPGQDTVDQRVENLEIQRAAIELELQSAENTRELLRRRLRLLYSMHHDLEEIVLNTFEDLGCDVVRPVNQKNEEDGWIRVIVDGGVREGVLEIKGTERKTFEMKGVRQLRDWVGKGLEVGKKYKGIFVGNAAAIADPISRSNPFVSNVVTYAESQDFVMIKSQDLYAAYERYSLGQLDVDRFWRELFNTKGEFDFPKHFP